MKAFADLIRNLKKADNFVVTMHVNPDPDALASALVMTLYLRSIGKKARLINQDKCPDWLEFCPRLSLYEQFDEKKHSRLKPGAIVVMDCGDFERIGAVARLKGEDALIFNIDHHVTNQKFGDFNVVLPNESSTSEILYHILKKAGCKLNRDMAELLYVGILTDTGSFGFDSTGPGTHRVVADLLQFGISVSGLYRNVYETLPKHDLLPFFKLFGRLEMFYDDCVASIVITKKDIGNFKTDFDLKDKIFNFLRSVKGLTVIVILTEQERGKVRLNFRSRDDFDVSKLAEKFGGGGHRKASGGFFNGSLKQAQNAVLKEIGKAL